jgi:hypothetical protein
MHLPRWFGCSLAIHETLAAGLIGSAGALVAASIAWRAVMRQIHAGADQTYDAICIELEPVIDILNMYWRVIDASIKNRKNMEWRKNGVAVIGALYPRPSGLEQTVNDINSAGLDLIRLRQLQDLKHRLSMLVQVLNRYNQEDKLWFENSRTMLTHFHGSLLKFDPVAAKKFERRKKSRVDNRSMAEHLETLVDTFERTGNIQ